MLKFYDENYRWDQDQMAPCGNLKLDFSTFDVFDSTIVLNGFYSPDSMYKCLGADFDTLNFKDPPTVQIQVNEDGELTLDSGDGIDILEDQITKWEKEDNEDAYLLADYNMRRTKTPAACGNLDFHSGMFKVIDGCVTLNIDELKENLAEAALNKDGYIPVTRTLPLRWTIATDRKTGVRSISLTTIVSP